MTLALYSAVDDVLTHYQVDVESATLTAGASVEAMAKVQYAWPHPSRNFLYVSTSSGGPRVKSDYNHVQAYAIEPDGGLLSHGEPRPLPRRPVHVCVDPAGRHVLNAQNYMSGGLTVHTIERDGAIGAEIAQDSANFGIYPHQVMMFPSGRTALVVDRGNNARPDRGEDPGALRTFAFEDGKLRDGQVVAPDAGYGFGPRHVDFHPSLPCLYVSDERRNRLHMFGFSNDRLDDQPQCSLDTLADPHAARARQLAGPIHVHPSGRFVYVVNRADATADHNGTPVFAGGENNIAVYAIDRQTGVPALAAHVDIRSIHVRTFALDPSGRLLVAASIKPGAFLANGTVTPVAAALTVFRIGGDGVPVFVRKYDVAIAGSQLHYWMGIAGVQ